MSEFHRFLLAGLVPFGPVVSFCTMRIGVDLGGSKIEAIALDDSGRETTRTRIPAPRDDYEATVRAVVDLIGQVRASLESPGRVGIGHPGTISPETQKLKNSNSTWLNGRPLAQDLETALQEPIRTANDANCFALSEATDGAGAGSSSVFGVILGTGVGGGLVVEGRVLGGANGIGGEWGHNPLPWPSADEFPGPSCYCGLEGCIETFLSGPALSHAHETDFGQRLAAKQIVETSVCQPDAARSLEKYAHRLSRALATVVNVFDPEVIVLGGGMSNAQMLYELVPRIWGEWVFSDTVRTRLRAPVHGDSSGVRGAAWLWPE